MTALTDIANDVSTKICHANVGKLKQKQQQKYYQIEQKRKRSTICKRK